MAAIKMDKFPGEVIADTIDTIISYYNKNKQIGDNEYGVTIYLRYKTETDDKGNIMYYKLYPVAYEVDYRADNDNDVGHICTYGKGCITNQIVESRELLKQYVTDRYYDAVDSILQII